MNIVDIIAKKRDGLELTTEEISYFVKGYTNKEIPDYQASALCMAIFFKSMTDREIADLTFSMLHSGDVIDLTSIEGIKVDKHSTGGVGDKTTLVVGPIVAACDTKLAKMSGRGLGHTGGTLDKLESIDGFSINVESDDFIKQVNEVGISVIGQTANLVPADKLLYSLRDVTGTVASIPLIASSIMSKKLASGADKIVLDVKCGNGAFMETIDDAKELANKMVAIGKLLNRETVAFITNMNQPLGLAVGNSIEVIEAIDTLNGNGPEDFTSLCVDLATEMICLAREDVDLAKAKKLVLESIDNKSALNKLVDLIDRQGGNKEFITNPDLFKQADEIIEVKALEAGYVKALDALMIGEAAMHLGAGRKVKTDAVDHSVGIILNKKISDYIEIDDVIAYVHTNKAANETIELIRKAYTLTSDEVKKPEMVYHIVR